MSAVESRLKELGLKLPAAKKPAFEYVAVAVSGNIAYVSGQLPWLDAARVISGKVGAGVDMEQAQEAARLCTLFALANLKRELGSLDAIERVVKVTGFVASAAGFNEQPKVIDAASKLLGEIFGENGRHARSAIGVAELPRDAAVEIEFIVALKSQPARSN
ncbi:MAG: RidA family protein [Burkholderiales bacterium]|nr:RidA family protein [Burkholderiales bacterium]